MGIREGLMRSLDHQTIDLVIRSMILIIRDALLISIEGMTTMTGCELNNSVNCI